MIRPARWDSRASGATPEETDDFNGLFEHLEPDVDVGPVRSQDVLVQVFAGAHAEEKASGQHRRRRCGGLCDHRRMDPDQRAGDAGPQPQPAGGLSDRPDDRPHKWTLPLPLGPWVEVVRDQRE